MKNAELIKALRQCRENDDCDTCEYNTGDSADCIDTMMAEAADELERLQGGYDNAIADARYRVEQVRELQAENADLRRQLSEKTELLNKAVEQLKSWGHLAYGGCSICANIHTEKCKSCIRDDIFGEIAKSPTDHWQWRGGEQDG
jgi:hypothetical protein